MATVAARSATLVLELRRRRISTDEYGRRSWVDEAPMERVSAAAAAVVVCDVWDRHWSKGAAQRIDVLAPRIDEFCHRMRRAGVLVVHAPSNTMAAYDMSPARARIAGRGDFLNSTSLDLPALPVSCSNGGSDTVDEVPADTRVWSRQHAAIWIDEGRDVITDDGAELAAYLRADRRTVVLVAGVHTNLCVLRRSFGLTALRSQGFRAVLVSDLTDAMYDPADPPYVDHDSGTRLVVGYIEAFVAPSTRSERIVIVDAG